MDIILFIFSVLVIFALIGNGLTIYNHIVSLKKPAPMQTAELLVQQENAAVMSITIVHKDGASDTYSSTEGEVWLKLPDFNRAPKSIEKLCQAIYTQKWAEEKLDKL